MIEFHAGLNIIEGADGAQNSIGKSTVLQIIDFVYGGRDFLQSDAVTLPTAVRHHIIYFTLRIHDTNHHFSRDTSRPGFVATYQDPNWTIPVDEVTIDDYMGFLLTSYGLEQTGTSWRDLVGRFSRVDESGIAILDKPLAAAAREPDTSAAAALLRLFGAYDEIEAIQSQYAKVRSEVDALDAMAKGQYSNYIKLTKKTDRDRAERVLTEAKAEARRVQRQADLDLFDADHKARQEQQLLRATLRSLTEQLDQLTGKLAIVEATLAGRTRITTDDLEEFYTYFPNANRERLETIEYYHQALAGILETQLNEQHHLYTTQVASLQAEIRQQKARIISLGESVQLDDETYQRSLDLHTKITQLNEQIRTFDRNQELKAQRKALKQEIEENIPATLGELTTQINAGMRDVMNALYPDQPRVAPIFAFKAAAKGVSYTFDHNGDTGSGAKFNHLVAFDIAVLRSTPLPFLIHDSAIIKLIAYKPVAELLTVYTNTANLTSRAGEPKQVFFSFDATKAYGAEAQERVAPAQVIHLGEGAQALYGFTWNTETTDHHDPHPSEGGQR
ncbi:DUF2326 domain-containing protein [Corynebacterium guaraldiae]|uniref:DUF2326 domain-containing protein n=1 Tax=Corynebacterium guaraldiae TaxID=3051103 RepID=UPI0020949ED0|nr:DUF2326 domain-containing protein [Corynebacterium guaraldiae]